MTCSFCNSSQFGIRLVLIGEQIGDANSEPNLWQLFTQQPAFAEAVKEIWSQGKLRRGTAIYLPSFLTFLVVSRVYVGFPQLDDTNRVELLVAALAQVSQTADLPGLADNQVPFCVAEFIELDFQYGGITQYDLEDALMDFKISGMADGRAITIFRGPWTDWARTPICPRIKHVSSLIDDAKWEPLDPQTLTVDLDWVRLRNRRVLLERLGVGVSSGRTYSVDSTPVAEWPSWMNELVLSDWRTWFLDRPKLLGMFQTSYQNLGESVWTSADTLPPVDLRWTVFNRCPVNSIRVVILGQDPYFNLGEASGIAFSVVAGVKIPPSLRRIYSALERSISGWTAPNHGCLDEWVSRGVFLVNMALTVKLGTAKSHSKYWNASMQELISEIARYHQTNKHPLYFMLWGNDAKSCAHLIDANFHRVLEYAHPSPLSRVDWSLCPHFAECQHLIDWRLAPQN